METKTCLNDVSLTIKDNILILERLNGFFLLDTSISGGVIKDVKSIITYSPDFQDDPSLKPEVDEKILENILKSKNVLEPAITTIGNYDIKNSINITQEHVTTIVTAGNNIHFPLNITILIDEKINDIALLEVLKSVVEAKTAVFCDFGIKKFNPYNHFNTDKDFILKDEITVACTGDEKQGHELDKIYIEVSKCINKALNQLLKNFGYPRDILGHIEDAGISIEDLVDAGMQLCVGVERDKELDIKLKNQLLKSLEDLNVAALIMAGIRLEEDFSRHRIRGIDVDDDPAYLYTDEVLGMALANQIAGTKAIFNFKRYDEEKPGIIGVLGPVLDDIFAGLVAGCMSKIFEE
jgi:alpha-ribazole phosphatase CobZ